jgi:hypothetical protein
MFETIHATDRCRDINPIVNFAPTSINVDFRSTRRRWPWGTSWPGIAAR